MSVMNERGRDRCPGGMYAAFVYMLRSVERSLVTYVTDACTVQSAVLRWSASPVGSVVCPSVRLSHRHARLYVHSTIIALIERATAAVTVVSCTSVPRLIDDLL